MQLVPRQWRRLVGQMVDVYTVTELYAKVAEGTAIMVRWYGDSSCLRGLAVENVKLVGFARASVVQSHYMLWSMCSCPGGRTFDIAQKTTMARRISVRDDCCNSGAQCLSLLMVQLQIAVGIQQLALHLVSIFGAVYVSYTVDYYS